ncbi:MAG: hypothetical protein KDJ78_07700 [Rhodobacteraceae bacterium]|nr:hypothetical protein [Paracoccaceae bacterium]MCB1402442.1 hypothetical protein [Paracoccaceae bacterium]
MTGASTTGNCGNQWTVPDGNGAPASDRARSLRVCADAFRGDDPGWSFGQCLDAILDARLPNAA